MTQALGVRRLLLPLTPGYRLALAAREFRLRRGWEAVRRLRFPVISIGNLSTGGAGKTPLAIGLARALTARGYAVDVLSRGYGRRSAAPARVDPGGSPDEFGDEPLLIARDAGVQVYVARDRYDAGLIAESERMPEVTRPRVHILDDAYQHRQLHRDVNILLLNREDWHDRLLPAGNLREPLQAIERADVIAIPESESDLEPQFRARHWRGPIWRLHRRIEVPRIDGPVVAFCGIARPGQFFSGLEGAGLRLAARIAFRDHHWYTKRDLERLKKLAQSAGANSFVTTKKDEIRLRWGGFSSAEDSSSDERTDGDSWSPTLATKGAARMGHGDPFAANDLHFFTGGVRIEILEEADALDWLIRRLSDPRARLSL